MTEYLGHSDTHRGVSCIMRCIKFLGLSEVFFFFFCLTSFSFEVQRRNKHLRLHLCCFFLHLKKTIQIKNLFKVDMFRPLMVSPMTVLVKSVTGLQVSPPSVLEM